MQGLKLDSEMFFHIGRISFLLLRSNAAVETFSKVTVIFSVAISFAKFCVDPETVGFLSFPTLINLA